MIDHVTTPSDPEAERSLIVTVAQGGVRCFADLPDVPPKAFHRVAHGALWALLVGRLGRGRPCDLGMLQALARAKDPSLLEQVPMSESQSTGFHSAGTLAALVLDLWQRRTMFQALAKARDRVCDRGTEIVDVMSEVEAAVLGLRTKDTGGWKSPEEVADEWLAEMYRLDKLRHEGRPVGITTGRSDFDGWMGSLGRGELTYLGARPSQGKTALMLAMLSAIRVNTGAPCAVFSLEMKQLQQANRVASAQSNIFATKFRHGEFTPQEFDQLKHVRDLLAKAVPSVNDKRGLTLSQVCSEARREKMRNPDLAVLAIDHVGKIQRDRSTRGLDENHFLGRVSEALAVLAGQLDVHVLALTQLNRSIEGDPVLTRRPMMKHLRNSGNLEQDADNVWTLWRPWYYADKGPNDEPGPVTKTLEKAGIPESRAELFAAKARYGAKDASLFLEWEPRTQRFNNIAEPAEEHTVASYSRAHRVGK